MRKILKIELLSDTCFGMPSKLANNTDTDIATDQLGLPFIPGKSLHGLLHDTWASIMQSGITEQYTRVGESLFGINRSIDDVGIMRIGNASLDVIIQDAIVKAVKRKENPVSPSTIRDAFSYTIERTAIDRKSGAAKNESLRSVRALPKNIVFYAPLEYTRELTLHELQVLTLVVGITRHAGYTRNRGLGHVKLTLTDGMPQTAVPKVELDESKHQWQIPFRLTLHAPCLISSLEYEPNSRGTRSFITGAAIRGAVAAIIKQTAKTEEQKHQDIEALITSGSLHFLNAYPELNQLRSIPKPVLWRRNKDPRYGDIDIQADPGQDINRNGEIIAAQVDDQNNIIQREELEAEFFADLGPWYPVEVKKEQHTHQKRNRSTGSANKNNDSQVFVYEAISAGQSFIGYISFADPAIFGKLSEYLAGRRLWLGRSLRSQYGGSAEITFLPDDPNKDESGKTFTPLAKDSVFLVQLTSDALLRDPDTGMHNPYGLKDAIEALFTSKSLTIVNQYIKTSFSRGFNKLWKTELPAEPVAAAGSMVVFKTSQEISKEGLQEIVSRSIGERQADGFGRFIIRSLNETVMFSSNRDEYEDDIPDDFNDELLNDLQSRVYERHYRALLLSNALEIAGNIGAADEKHQPTLSLLGRLRTPLQNDDWLKTYKVWFELDPPAPDDKKNNHALKKPAKDVLDRVEINGQTMYEWLKSAVSQSDFMPSPNSEYSIREQYRFVSKPKSALIWADVKEKSRRYYIELVLSQIRRQIKK